MRFVGALIAVLLLVACVMLVMHMLASSVGALNQKGKANLQTCLSNQHQLAVAIQMYMQDYHDTCFPDPGKSAWSYNVVINDYIIPSTKLADCPSTSRKGTAVAPDYGFNAQLYGVTSKQIPQPANTIFTADLAPTAMRGSYALTTNDDLDLRHSLKRAVVVSAADGHALAVTRQGDETLEQALAREKISLKP